MKDKKKKKSEWDWIPGLKTLQSIKHYVNNYNPIQVKNNKR